MKAQTKNKKHQIRQADVLFSRLIRSRQYCELRVLAPTTKCSPLLQTCHILSRRYKSLRWWEGNALCGCSAHHTYFTMRPEAWMLAIQKEWPGRFERLYEQAQQRWDGEIPIAYLKEQLARIDDSAVSL